MFLENDLISSSKSLSELSIVETWKSKKISYRVLAIKLWSLFSIKKIIGFYLEVDPEKKFWATRWREKFCLGLLGGSGGMLTRKILKV